MSEPKTGMTDVFKAAIERGASDLYIKAGDVILIGEMRDTETIDIALKATETREPVHLDRPHPERGPDDLSCDCRVRQVRAGDAEDPTLRELPGGGLPAAAP